MSNRPILTLSPFFFLGLALGQSQRVRSELGLHTPDDERAMIHVCAVVYAEARYAGMPGEGVPS